MSVSALAAALSAASLNLCTDEYLLLLARPGEIASVSFLSQDPEESPLWRSARNHPSNRGSLEQAVGTRPTLVLTMGGGGRSTAMIAGRLGIRSVELEPNSSLADVESNLVRVAEALGDRRRADPWLKALRRLKADAPRRAFDSIWLSGGGQTLASTSAGAQWLRLAGLRQRSVGGDRVGLETLLVRPPQVLVQSRYRSAQVSGGQRWLSHPIVRRAGSLRIDTDGRRWTCMGPLLIGEIARLKSKLQ